MKTFFFILAAISAASGYGYGPGVRLDGFRAKFGWSESLADKEYFFKIPRTISNAESQGWKRTERPPGGVLPELRMYCPPGRAVCPLFDAGGFVAGLQLALPVSDYDLGAIKPDKFVKWNAPAANGEPANDYWTLTQYYVTEESLKAGAGPQAANGETLQDGGVWVTGLDGKLLKISTSEAGLKTTAFTKQNCVPKMGTHYFYNMTRDMRCEDHLPWFVLTNKGDTIGTGFMMFGKLAEPKTRNWFEKPVTTEQVKEVIIPDAPQCFEEWETKYGLVLLHIYYVNDPYNIRCETGDSVKPARVLDRLLLSAVRYASQVSDGVRSLFSG